MRILVNKDLILEGIEKFCFYLLLFTIPFQTRKFIWAQNWPINEWTSIWFWGTDILILILLSVWIWSLFQNKKWFSFWRSDKFWIILGGLFWLWAGISLVSHLNYLSFYHWLKLAEIILFFLCLKDLADRKFLSEKVVILTLLTSGLFQSVLAISQFFKQSNLGLRILGESILSSTLAGVAKINLGGIKLIRAYGTFPHPSILAFFLSIIILFSLGYLIKTHLRQTKWLFSLFWLASSLFWLALFLTFSRTTIILAL
ncbi:MAG TPA: hypothetical protein ENL06_01070, partial [Candidatus Portnoybacteria bacterium]|nr:hypothetical protein [Candidatus Portnoybacteria bacterium]